MPELTEKMDTSGTKSTETSVKRLKSYSHNASDDDIEVTFEVLLSPSMFVPDSTVRIVIGPPVSEWDASMVEMKVKPGTPEVLQPGNYRYLVGTLPLNKKFLNKSIPYKYVVQHKDGELVWEHIKFNFEEGILNRCLMVPSKTGKVFTKFDDVILSKDADKSLNKSMYELQRLGRNTATKWMLPRPIEFDDPNLDFEAALDRFQSLIVAHGDNGTKLCLEDIPKHKHNPIGYNIQACIQNYIKGWFEKLSEYQHSADDAGRAFRVAIFLSLLRRTKHVEMNEEKQLLAIAMAFYNAREFLFQPEESFPNSVSGEIQLRIVESLKKIVQDFVDLRGAEAETSGHWIFVVPFINFWDTTGESNWLQLRAWKSGLRR